MRNSQAVRERKVRRPAALVAALFVFAALPLLSSARARSASVNVANNSSREIIHIYLAHADQDDWGAACPANRALSAANACLYGVCHAAVVSAGYSAVLGFIHTGKLPTNGPARNW